MSEVTYIPEMSKDKRLRVFRRMLSLEGEFDGMQVDAYVLLAERYVLICDTLLCPEDMATMLDAVHGELNGRKVLVVNSHADWDHTWGNCYFAGAHQAS